LGLGAGQSQPEKCPRAGRHGSSHDTWLRHIQLVASVAWLVGIPNFPFAPATTNAHFYGLTPFTEVDYAQLVKIYGNPTEGSEVRYSPAQCMGARKAVISGKPEIQHISTSHTERQNLSMRMGMRRFTRLTNAFSKKVENHEHMIALYFMHYNFCRIHQTLRCTPAMEAGISNHVWTLEEIVDLI